MRCVHCKSPRHIEENCPLYAKSKAQWKVAQKLTSPDFFGAAPSPFIGRFGYPDVHVGILTPPQEQEQAWLHDAPNYWSFSNYQIPQIVDLRSALVNSRFKTHVKSRQHRWLELVQEVGMASRPVDVEISLKKVPRFALQTDPYSAPMGPSAELNKARVTSNPKINTKVEKVYSDTDLKASEALRYLYNRGFDENRLSHILSVGAIGIQKNRKLVPSRWGITATDDLLGKHILQEIKDYQFQDYAAYFGGYLGNYYLVLFFPEPWSYELFEMYLPGEKIQYATDYESFYGRKEYANETAGGYYAARLPILEKLKEVKRQASVLALRFITAEYTLPLGVFVVREATRKSLDSKPINFASRDLLLKYAQVFSEKWFDFDVSHVLKQSKLLNCLKKQRKLSEFK